MRNLLNTRPNPAPVHLDEHTLGEYVETIDNTPVPEGKEEPSVEVCSDAITVNQHGENNDNTLGTTEIKIEDNQDTKEISDNTHLSINGPQASEEVFTFVSPAAKIKEE